MKILTSLNNFLTKNRKNILYIFWFFFIFFMLYDASFASTTSVSDSNPQNKNIGISIVNGILKNLAALLWLLTFLVGLFLYPEWTSGSIVWLWWNAWALKQMWIMISNVVYFIFALIFIWIAFMNIIWKEDWYQLKEALPRFIVWVLIVPFTWFFVQFILSISSILTVGVLSLPYDTFKDTYMKDTVLDEVKFCKDWVIYASSQSWSTNIMDCKKWSEKIPLSQIVNPKKSESLFWIMTVYTYGIMSVDGQWKIYSENFAVNGIANLFDLWVKVIFDLIFVIVYFLLMIALALALFVRWVYLWFYAMLSPIFWLLYFFKKEKDWVWWDVGKRFNLKEFVSLAFVPVYVSAALAFWLLFLFAAGNSWTKQSDVLSPDGKTVKHAGFTYTIEWAASNDGDVKQGLWKLFEWFQWTFGTLILQIFWLAILWIAVMAALKQSEITSTVSAPFDDFGKSIWQLAMKAPTYAPIIPTGSGAMSAASLGSAWQSFQSTIAWEYSTKWSRFGQEAAKGMFWIWDDMLNKLDELIKKPYTTQSDIQKWMQEWLQAIDADRFKNDPNVKNKLADLFQKLWAETWLIAKVKWAKDVNELSQILQKSWNSDWKTQEAKDAARNFLNNKTPAQIEALISWVSWNSQSQPNTPLPAGITKDTNTPWKYDVWEWLNKTTINVTNNGKNLNQGDITSLATALQATRNENDWENKVKQILTSMWITDVSKQTEVLNKISSTTTTPPPTQNQTPPPTQTP